MKTVLVTLFILLISSSAFATPPGSDGIPQPDEESDTPEALALTAGTALAFVNAAMMGAKVPNYWVGGLGIVAGMTNIAAVLGDEPHYEVGLWASGFAAILTGAAAMRYRYVLNRTETQAHVQPAWTHGSPGLALVIDF